MTAAFSKVHFSSASDAWSTPPDFFAKVEAEFGPFDLDPCATAENAKAPKFYTIKDSGLAHPWFGKVWLNPPYGRGIKHWIRRAAWETCRVGLLATCEGQFPMPDLTVCLLPARVDTSYWHDYVIPYASEVRFIRGRLKFGNSKNSAPFPSALVIFRRKD